MNEPLLLRRTSLFPKKTSDYPLLMFISFMIPATYWYQIWVVLPALFSEYPLIYWTVFIVGHFCLHNVVGNFLAILMFDTSIRGRKMPSEEEPRVQYCSTCNTCTPPRSFHCPSCEICILKRDHHCLFTGCCVGFYNHRYFIFFVFYIMLSTVVFLPLNFYFLWLRISFTEFTFFLMAFFPVFLFLSDDTPNNIEYGHFYIVITVMCLFGSLICVIWFYFHMKLILRGTVVHELKKCINIYNFGQEKNIQLVFGKRWYLTWISPYIKSPLICDGIRYPIKEEDRRQSDTESGKTYGAEIWGLAEQRKFKGIQEKYLKWSLGVDPAVPGYIVLEETKREKIRIEAGKRAVGFEEKIIRGENEILKTCLKEMEKEKKKNQNGHCKENFVKLTDCN